MDELIRGLDGPRTAQQEKINAYAGEVKAQRISRLEAG